MDDKLVIILDELKFDWKESQLQKITEFWENGYSLHYMTKYFGRRSELGIRQIEVALAIMHLDLNGIIKERPGGMLGHKGE